MKKKGFASLELSKEEFEYLKDCMLIFQDAFEINKMIDESCMAILLELRKGERKELNGFVDELGDWIARWENENRENTKKDEL